MIQVSSLAEKNQRRWSCAALPARQSKSGEAGSSTIATVGPASDWLPRFACDRKTRNTAARAARLSSFGLAG